MKKHFVFIILYLLFVIGFCIYNSKKEYLFINNDFMFNISGNNIKVVKKYPSYINNSSIHYYNNGLREDGYIKFNDNSLMINQEKGNNIYFYTTEYKLVKGYNTIANYGKRKIELLDINDYKNDEISEVDKKIISDTIDEDITSISNIKYDKYVIDINNDKKNDYIYVINSNVESSLLATNNDLLSAVIISFNGENNQLLFTDSGSSIKHYYLNNIFDLNNDHNYELNFTVYDSSDIYYNCQSIVRVDNNKLDEIKNCIKEEK